MSDGFTATSTSTSGFSPPTPAPQAPTYQAEGGAAAGSTTEVAKDQAAEMTATAQQAGSQIKDTVSEQAGAVAAEAGRQAKQLLDQARTELSDQAATQQQRVAGGLQSLADELDEMVDGSAQAGLATDVARMGADKAREVAQWLDGRDPGSLLEEVRSYARRRPGTYLAIALGAGVLAGRLTRGLTASTDSPGTAASRPAVGNGTAAADRPEFGDFQPVPAIGNGHGPGNAGDYGNGFGNGAFGSDDDLATAPEMVPGRVVAPPSAGLGTGPILGRPQGDSQR